MESKELKWDAGDINYLLQVRNVGDKNIKNRIQFVLDRYDRYKERRLPLVTFSIPTELVKEFMEGLKEPSPNGDRND